MNTTSFSTILNEHPDVVSIQKLRRPGITIKKHKDNKKEILMYHIDYNRDKSFNMRLSISNFEVHNLSVVNFIEMLYRHIQQIKNNMRSHFGYDPIIFFGDSMNYPHMGAIEITFTAFGKSKSESVIKLMEFYD